MNHERGQRFLLDLPSLRLDLPFSPILLEKLFTLTGEGSMAPPGDIADTLAKDQGLTAKILTMANSAFYGLQSEVRTVHRAVTVLGLNEIRTLVLALGVKHLAASHTLPPAFDVPAYFEHQLAVGLTAKELSPLLGVADADNLFTAGVLHDLGKLLTAQHRPDDWLAIESLCAAENILYHPAEERYWGLDHGLIGAMVLKSWNLPPSSPNPSTGTTPPPTPPPTGARPSPCVPPTPWSGASKTPPSPATLPGGGCSKNSISTPRPPWPPSKPCSQPAPSTCSPWRPKTPDPDAGAPPPRPRRGHHAPAPLTRRRGLTRRFAPGQSPPAKSALHGPMALPADMIASVPHDFRWVLSRRKAPGQNPPESGVRGE